MTFDRMRTWMGMVGLVFAMLACTATSDDTSAAAGAGSATAMSAGMQADVQKAAAIANATTAAPTKGDSILAANRLTADELEAMMYRIAADSTASAEYRRLTSGS